MRTRFAWPIAFGLVLALAAAACGKKASPGGGPSATGQKISTKKAGALTVGSCLDYKPFEFYEGQTLKGFDVEIMQEIAKRLNLKAEWVKADFDTIFTSLAAGQFDAVAAASTIKPERQQVVDFSDPYYNARQSLAVNTTKTPAVTSTDQLKSGDVVGVQKGTTGKDWAEANLGTKGIDIKTYTSITDAFTDLEAGQLAGIVNDEPSSQAEVQGRPGLKVVQPIDTGEFYGIAVGKDHKDILDGINRSLKAMIGDGTYRTIFQKYFPGVPVPPQFGG
jgi:polar amino acid transport system substrate-binding protein